MKIPLTLSVVVSVSAAHASITPIEVYRGLQTHVNGTNQIGTYESTNWQHQDFPEHPLSLYDVSSTTSHPQLNAYAFATHESSMFSGEDEFLSLVVRAETGVTRRDGESTQATSSAWLIANFSVSQPVQTQISTGMFSSGAFTQGFAEALFTLRRDGQTVASWHLNSQFGFAYADIEWSFTPGQWSVISRVDSRVSMIDGLEDASRSTLSRLSVQITTIPAAPTCALGLALLSCARRHRSCRSALGGEDAKLGGCNRFVVRS